MKYIKFTIAHIILMLASIPEYLTYCGKMQTFRFKMFPKSSVLVLLFSFTLLHYWDFYFTLVLATMVLDFIAFYIWTAPIKEVVDTDLPNLQETLNG